VSPKKASAGTAMPCPDGASVALLPIAGLRPRDVEHLAQDLSALGFDVEVLPERPLPPGAYDERRRQYRAEVFVALALIEAARRRPRARILALTDVDLYASNLKFVFGIAESPGRAAVISFHRLRAGADERRLRERAVKEAVHELGHSLGLAHCPTSRCVMYFSNSLADTDRKTAAPCPACREA
jgi:archaemetzincin